MVDQESANYGPLTLTRVVHVMQMSYAHWEEKHAFDFKDVLHRCRKNIFEALIYAVKMVGEA